MPLAGVISARTAADETSLLRQVAQGLSINQASLEAILTKVAQLAITGQDVYLMVDDAEQLQDSALEVLLLLYVSGIASFGTMPYLVTKSATPVN